MDDNSILDSKSIEDKKLLIFEILKKMNADLKSTLESASAAHKGATHEDAVAKSKHDTHGLELSYLAGSQYERARLLEADIKGLSNMPISTHQKNESISLGLLIDLVNHKGSHSLLFLSPFGAGLEVHWQNTTIKVISPKSPLGEILIDSYVDDIIEPPGSIQQKTIKSCL